MKKVEIYTTPTCGYCFAAKRLLTRKGVEYDEYDVAGNPQLRQAMVERSAGRRTVPQIFIDDAPIGGFEELAELDADGQLDPILAA